MLKLKVHFRYFKNQLKFIKKCLHLEKLFVIMVKVTL